MQVKAIAMVFNTHNLNYSLVIDLNGLSVHTKICESQARQIKEHLQLRGGEMGTDTNYTTGAKHAGQVYWDL